MLETRYSTGLFVQLLAEDLCSWPHLGILATHSSLQGALELGAEGQLAHGVGLFLAEKNALGGEGLVLHSLEAGGDVADLGVGGVRGLDGRSKGGRHAVGTEADRGSGLERD